MQIQDLQIEIVNIDSVFQDTANARKHGDQNLATIRASLREHGQYRPVIVQRGGNRILVGNGTHHAAKLEGWSQLKVSFVDVDDLQAARLAIVDNRSAELAEWDDEVLATTLAQVGELDGLGFTPEDFDELLARVSPPTSVGNDAEDPGEVDEDQLATLRAKWQTESGQLWLLPSQSLSEQSHRLLIGDSTDAGTVRRLMNGQRASLFATDPPYLVDYDGKNHPHAWGDADKNKDWSETYQDWDDSAQGEALYDGFIKVALAEAITDHAAWYCWHATRRQALLEQIWERHGAFVHQQIIWVKDRPVLTRSYYMWQHEPCFFGWIKGNKPARYAEDYPATIWSFPTLKPGTSTLHPTSKPVDLFLIPMQQHTQAGDICYEPFSGSGSQLVAGERLGRLVYGLEKSPEYVAGILERLSGMGLTPALAS